MKIKTFSKLRLSLGLKFLIALSVVILIIIPLASYMFFTQSIRVLNEETAQKARILKENLKEKGVAMSRNIALNISSAVAGSDFTFLQNVISSTVASDKEIRFAIIMNQAGRALVHSDPLKALQILEGPQDKKSNATKDLTVFEYQMNDEDIVEVAIPIMLGEERWGTLRMGYTLQFLNQEIRKSLIRGKEERRALIRTAVLIAAVSMISAAIFSILFSRHVVRAVRAIVNATQKVAKGDFTPRVDIETGDELETLGNAINVMTENLDKLNQEVFQKARMESEMNTAQLVQKKIMPKKDPKYPQMEFSSYFRSSSETGGDWFAYSLQPDKDTISVLIADVTGHGLPAALLTEAAHSCFQTMNTLHLQPQPNDILKLLNKVLIPSMGEQFGMTAFVSNIKLSTLEMAFSNAGHNMPLYIQPENGNVDRNSIRTVVARGPRLGDSPNDDFAVEIMTLEKNMMLFWYTDGLLDCTNEQGATFGKRKLLNLLAENYNLSSRQFRDLLVDEIMQFTGGARPPDDITFIIGRVL